LDEVGGTLRNEELNAFHPADRPSDLANQAVAGVRTTGDKAGVDVGRDWNDGVIEDDGFKVLGKGILGRLHESAVERSTDLKHDRALRSSLFAAIGGKL